MSAIDTKIGAQKQAHDVTNQPNAAVPYSNVWDALQMMRGLLPATSVDNTIPRFNGVGGALQGSGITIDDSDVVAGAKILSSGSAIARSLESRFADVIYVDDYAVGDGVTDDKNALAAVATRARSLGGCRIEFGNKKTYLVYGTNPAAGAYNLMDLSGCDGVTVNFNGSKIISAVNFGIGIAFRVFVLSGSTRIRINDYNAEQTFYTQADASNGFMGVYISDTNSQIHLSNPRQRYGRSIIECIRSSELTLANRARLITFDNLFADNVFYPVNFQKNGDQVSGSMRTLNPGRSYFPYNVHQHHIFVESIPGPNTIDDVLIKSYALSTESAASNTTSDIHVTYKSRQQDAAASSSHVAIAIGQQNGTTAAATMRNIRVDAKIDVSSAPNETRGILIEKTLSDGTADTTARGHVLENISIAGALNNFTNSQDLFQFGQVGTWAGETVNNIALDDLVTGGSGSGAVHINALGVSSLKIAHVRSAHNLTLTNEPAGVIARYGSVFANYTSEHARFGSVLIGQFPVTPATAMFGNRALDQTVATNYALLQDSSGTTYHNAPVGQTQRFRIGNADKGILTSGGLWGFGTVAPFGVVTAIGGATNIGGFQGGTLGDANGYTGQFLQIGYDVSGDFGLIQAANWGTAYRGLTYNALSHTFKLSNSTDGLTVAAAGATIATGVTVPKVIGGVGTTSTLTYQATTGVGTTGADHIWLVGNNGATEGMRLTNAGLFGVGTNNPLTALHVASPSTVIFVDSISTSAAPAFTGRGARGTLASPTAVQTNDGLFLVGGRGYGATAYSGGSRAAIAINAAENWTDSAQGAYMDLSTTAIGGTSRTTRVRITDVGNAKLGGTANRGTTEGANHLDIFNGTAPAGTLTNGVSLYSDSGVLRAMDAGGVDTQLTFAAPSSIGTGAKTISNGADSPTNFGKYLVGKVNGVTIYIPCSTVAPT